MVGTVSQIFEPENSSHDFPVLMDTRGKKKVEITRKSCLNFFRMLGPGHQGRRLECYQFYSNLKYKEAYSDFHIYQKIRKQ